MLRRHLHRNLLVTLAAGSALALGAVASSHGTATAVAARSTGVTSPTDMAGMMSLMGNSTAQAGGSSDLFLTIDGIPGEAIATGHEGQIEIAGYNFGAKNTITQNGTRPTAGKVSFSEFSFTKNIDKASPLLLQRAADGKSIKTVTLTATKVTGAGTPQTYLTITLTDVLVSSYQNNDEAGGSASDAVDLAFSKISYDYRAQDPKTGKLSTTPVHGGWDTTKNAPA